MIEDRFTRWFDQFVQEWSPAEGEPDFSESKVFRFRSGYNEKPTVREILKAFCEHDAAIETEAIIIGMDDDFTYGHSSAPIIELLAENRDRLPRLKGLYIGEIEQEENEISWINNCDMTPLLVEFPGLEELRIRGGNGLAFQPTRHICLKKLVIETGGLDKSVLPPLLESVFPELQHLELWLGDDYYGWNGSAEDVRPFFYQNPYPKLNYLGIKNCIHQNEIAKLAADAPVLEQIETLDLGAGTLRDEGGEALLNSENVRSLKHLDLSHHFLCDEMMVRFESSDLSDVVNLDDQEEPDDWGDGENHYYISVSE